MFKLLYIFTRAKIYTKKKKPLFLIKKKLHWCLKNVLQVATKVAKLHLKHCHRNSNTLSMKLFIKKRSL